MRRRRAVARAAPALIGLIGLVAVQGHREALRDPTVRRLDVAVRGWPEGAPPVRLALLSDIHFGARSMDAARLRGIVAQVNAAHPDIVLLAGDMVIGHDASGADARAAGLTAPLAGLRAPMGVVAVLGNHDHWTASAAIRAALALARAGIAALSNDALRRVPIALLGVDDRYSGHADVAATLAAWRRVGGVPVVLTHAPDLTHQLPPVWALLLAGHTHCGQVVLPGLGPLLRLSPHEHWRLP